MKNALFNTELHQYSKDFNKSNYVVMKDIISDKFLGQIRTFYEGTLDGSIAEREQFKIKNKKSQYLFEFSSNDDVLAFKEALCSVTGWEVDETILSERHLKVYDEQAADYPYPHKDRAASGISVGLPIHLPPQSELYVFPELEPGENEIENASFLSSKDYPIVNELYDRPDAISIKQNVGDMVVFLGSAMYHERVKASGTAILYCKLNNIGRNPLNADTVDSY
ncbi:MAG: hypothetical protein V3U84_04995 [Thiotrichaceae bacterium]